MTERYAVSNWNNGMGSYPTKAEEVACSAPTIAEVVMWVYEKHGIWINVERHEPKSLFNWVIIYQDDVAVKESRGNGYKSPTEAYEAAIEYCLTNLIKEHGKEKM